MSIGTFQFSQNDEEGDDMPPSAFYSAVSCGFSAPEELHHRGVWPHP